MVTLVSEDIVKEPEDTYREVGIVIRETVDQRVKLGSVPGFQLVES